MPSRHPRRLPVALAVLALAVAACGSPAATPGVAPWTSAPAGTPRASVSPPATPAEGTPGSAPDPRAILESLPWAARTLTDVATGRAFRIADFAGRTVFVETMAIWCSNCRAQQARFREALGRLDPSLVAYVVLSVDPGETGEALERYRSEQGFLGTYAVAGREVSAALVEAFGPNAINPPSVPVVVVRPDGSVEFGTGPKSVEEILAAVGG